MLPAARKQQLPHLCDQECTTMANWSLSACIERPQDAISLVGRGVQSSTYDTTMMLRMPHHCGGPG
eukprot:4401712-Amphidinium_carterae.1